MKAAAVSILFFSLMATQAWAKCHNFTVVCEDPSQHPDFVHVSVVYDCKQQTAELRSERYVGSRTTTRYVSQLISTLTDSEFKLVPVLASYPVEQGFLPIISNSTRLQHATKNALLEANWTTKNLHRVSVIMTVEERHVKAVFSVDGALATVSHCIAAPHGD